MKFLILIILLTGIWSCTQGQYTKDRYHHKDIIAENQVASYEIYTWHGDKDSTLDEVLEFDGKGNLVREETFKYPAWTEYRYDSLDRIIAEESYASGINFYELDTFIYDQSNLVRVETFDSVGNLKMYRTYEYEDSLLVANNWTIVGRGGPKRTTYEYDSLGRKTAEIEESYARRTEFAYDSLGNLIEFRMMDSHGTVSIRDEFNYKGKLRTEEVYYSNHSSSAGRIEYSETGLILRELVCDSFPTSRENCSIRKVYHYQYR